MDKLTFFCFFSLFILTGCQESDTSSTSGAIVFSPLTVQDTSYKNFKEVGLTPQYLPSSRSGTEFIRTFSDFTQNGQLDMFTVIFQSPWPPTTEDEQVPALIEIWQNNNGEFTQQQNLITNTDNACTHPRKAIVADFNKDNIPDVFIACHGFDASPFPGEKNNIVLSQPDGSFLLDYASEDIGFFHGASAALINEDAYPDILVVDSNDSKQLFFLLNDGTGHFSREEVARLPYADIVSNGHYTAELVDINGDEYVDLITGGHEHEGADTQVFFNNGNNYFNEIDPIVIPSTGIAPVVLDFAVTVNNAQTTIWLNRTNTDYGSRVLQKVAWPSLSSEITLNNNPAEWVLWILPATVGGEKIIATEDASLGGYVLYD